MPKPRKSLLDRLKGLVSDDKQSELETILSEDDDDDAPPQSQPETPPAQPSGPDASVVEAVNGLRQQVSALSKALSDEKKAREDAVKALEGQQLAERQEKISSLLDEAVKQGKFAAEQRDTWKERLEKDFDGYKGVIEEMAGQQKSSADAQKDQKTPSAQPPVTGQLDRGALVDAAKSAFKTSAN